MGAIPHSGDKCSGLCETPCPHEGCWQCEEVIEEVIVEHFRKRIDNRLMELNRTTATIKAQTSKFAIPAPAKAQDQKAMITRGALEALAEKAGVRMNWNNGAPEFFDDSVRDREKRYVDAERKVLEEKVKELEHIAAQQNSGILSQQAANSMAKAAAQQMDQTVSDILKARVEETLVADAVANEEAAIAKLKANGVSDADIDAAKALMGWRPDSSDFVMTDEIAEWHDEVIPPTSLMGSQPLTVEDIKRAVESMKRASVGVPVPRITIMGAYEDLIREKMEQTLRASLPHLTTVFFKGGLTDG